MSKSAKFVGSRFSVGDKVRVRPGVTDPNYPDLPIGGWAGEIEEIDEEPPVTFLIRWSKETLRQIPAIHRKRSERDGLEIEEMWLGEEDLEPDAGGPVQVEQPTNIVTRPLAEDDQDDRIRAVFGLTSDDPLPDVSEETLQTFGEFLAANLSFPFDAKWTPEYGAEERIKIVSLSDPEDGAWIDDPRGLTCEAKLGKERACVPLAECEAVKAGPNRRLLGDYSFWFWNS